jgi:Flp pilus assembly secretin CpaC
MAVEAGFEEMWKRYQNNETELVVFVTPKTSDKHTEAQQKQMDKSIERLDKSGRLKLLPAKKQEETSDASKVLSGTTSYE